MPQSLDGSRGLKRHDALIPLSRDHHFALIYALSLRRAAVAPLGAGRGAVATAESFLSFYEEELLGHMADEEEALLPLVGDEASPADIARLVAEHEDIREGTAVLRQGLEEGTDPRGSMQDLGNLLHDHVRFEERAFFETVQLALSEERLAIVGRRIEEHRRDRNRAEGCRLFPAGIILPSRKL